jgi:hypothetical protein
VVRARHAGAYAGLRFGAGSDAVLPGNLRRSGRSHTVCLLPVLAADVGRRLHHGKQQTNHHENCQSRCDDHKRIPIPTHRIAIVGPFELLDFSWRSLWRSVARCDRISSSVCQKCRWHGGAGNLACSRLFRRLFRARRNICPVDGRRLKAGGSQEWLPHKLCRMVVVQR